MSYRPSLSSAALFSLLSAAAFHSAGADELVVGGQGRNCIEDPQCINRLHPDLPMTARAKPGQTIVLHTRNAGDFDLDPNSRYEDPRRATGNTGHALTGPVHIEGARAGDTLAVTLLEVAPGPWGKTWVGAGGFLADHYPTGFSATWKLGADYARSADIPGVRIPISAFPGVITTLPDDAMVRKAMARESAIDALGARVFLPNPTNATPEAFCGPTGSVKEECLRTIPPREHGGNMDIRYMRAGVTIHLPCLVDGCGLAIGDVHYAQGDGEVSGTAIEMDATVTLRTEILKEAPAKGVSFTGPVSTLGIPSKRYFATTGLPFKKAGEIPSDMAYLDSVRLAALESLPDDIALAARNALLAMIDHLVTHYGYSVDQAYVICSVAVDLRIGQLVDAPNAGAVALLPLDIFVEEEPGK
ncbi:acetamidase/formamidase family protein [Congregibacter litoralis]|uniref:Putative acetamidase/formamidase n=1 Tax=Congregibacter litoralis KT71 TaxID=314285 RepID=A4A744_9GAMM|nr:acetamidase/formamidase family protein [Congregibacter litoralis]EAQ98113.2 putative acetamidase/formamidase [Congregibacter litoralis KT71]